jgi:hypothetical protein
MVEYGTDNHVGLLTRVAGVTPGNNRRNRQQSQKGDQIQRRPTRLHEISLELNSGESAGTLERTESVLFIPGVPGVVKEPTEK